MICKEIYNILVLFGSVFWLRAGQCNSFKFYIYEWPRNVTDVYPDPSVPLVSGPRGKGKVTIYKTHSYRENFFFGRLLDQELGLYDTFTFALYKVILARLCRHPSRTLNYSEADAFFVPYDIGYNVIINSHTGRERSMAWSGCDIAPFASELFKNEIARNPNKLDFGHDHFMIFDLSNGHHMQESCYKFLSLCANCTILSIETLLYNTPYSDWMNEYHIPIARKWSGIPFPAAIHWNIHMKNNSYPWNFNRFIRQRLSVFWGNPWVQNKYASRLRYKIIEQCRAVHNDECSTYGSGKQGRAHHNVSDLLIYTNTTFCIHPAGDAETRKGIFDSLLLGCIPVVFSPDVMYRVYGWYFSKQDALDTTVFISSKDVLNFNVSVVDVLKKIPRGKIIDMQKAIERIGPSLQYAVPPVSEDTIWSPPVPDAVDHFMDKLEKRILQYKINKTIPIKDKFAVPDTGDYTSVVQLLPLCRERRGDRTSSHRNIWRKRSSW
eukprot:gene11284-23611_t